ncbi:ABC transporter permease [Corynebacterium glyciniphilum]|uniref:ABC transporter permease n=1 Tax=Corynebacterium glyciniphilum TaxID=1404244 RepID=UPI0011AB41FB|nr:ABC transporter permease [Corynebacterium glyciniphilum]
MRALSVEMIKLKRSLSWLVVVLLPIAVTVLGAATNLTRGEQPEDGWHTVWLQSVGFHGLFPLALGVAVLASLVWRSEHHGSNWNALMSGPTPTATIVAAKSAVVAGMAALIQLIMLGAVIVVGAVAFDLPGMLPAEYLWTTLLVIIAVVPLAVLQSSFSMLSRSFAAPIAVALVGTGVSVVALMVIGTPAVISPYGLATRATQLGTGTFSDTGTVTVGGVVTVLVASAALTVALIAATTAILERRDTRG